MSDIDLSDPAELSAFLDTYLAKKYPQAVQPFYRAQVTAVAATTGQPTKVQIQRPYETSQTDQGWYVVGTPGYMPAAGDSIDMQRRDASSAYAMSPVGPGADLASMTSIQKVTITSAMNNPSTVTFGAMPTGTNITLPQTYTHLALVANGSGSRTDAQWTNLQYVLNQDTSAHYGAITADQSNGTPSPVGTWSGGQTHIPWGILIGSLEFATSGAGRTVFFDYTNTLFPKALASEGYRGDSGGCEVSRRGGFWSQTTPIYQISVSCDSGYFVVGSTLELFGIM